MYNEGVVGGTTLGGVNAAYRLRTTYMYVMAPALAEATYSIAATAGA